MSIGLVVGSNKKLVVEKVSPPKCGVKDLLIRVTHVAQNPPDWKQLESGSAKPGTILGSDFAGEVIDVGREAAGNYRRGDRVAGCVGNGAFAMFVVQEASLVFRCPSTMTLESASTISFALITAALGLFHHMNLPMPPNTNDESLLVWSGSTSVGQYAIQLGKASGCFVITTASTDRHSYLKELGVDLCFDYKDANVVQKIKEITTNRLIYAIDCVSNKDSIRSVCSILSNETTCHLATVVPALPNEIPNHIQEHSIFIYTIFGRDIELMGKTYKAKLEEKIFAEKFMKLLSDLLLPQGFVKPNQTTKLPGGLAGIEQGFQKMKNNQVKGEKLVYSIDETVYNNNVSFTNRCRK